MKDVQRYFIAFTVRTANTSCSTNVIDNLLTLMGLSLHVIRTKTDEQHPILILSQREKSMKSGTCTAALVNGQGVLTPEYNNILK